MRFGSLFAAPRTHAKLARLRASPREVGSSPFGSTFRHLQLRERGQVSVPVYGNPVSLSAIRGRGGGQLDSGEGLLSR